MAISHGGVEDNYSDLYLLTIHHPLFLEITGQHGQQKSKHIELSFSSRFLHASSILPLPGQP